MSEIYFDYIRLKKELKFQQKIGMLEEHELHMHDVLEIHVLRQNEARFRLTDTEYDGQPGDVFLFRPFEPHWNLVKNPDKPIQWISIVFSPSIVRLIPNGPGLLTPFYAVEAVSPYISAESECALAVQKLASKAIQEEEEKKPRWETRQFIYFVDILVHILRHSLDSQMMKSEGELEEGIIQAIEYLLSHFTEPVQVDRLVSVSGLGRTLFYRKFKSVTGITPNQFVHRLRMQMAIYLLDSTDKSITEIAFECGYESIHYFNKNFHQYRAMSPREHRKRSVNPRK